MANQPSQPAASHHQLGVKPLTAPLLYQALNGVSAAVYVKDRSHRWIFANAACCRLLQRTANQLINVQEANLFPEATAHQLKQQDEVAFQRQTAGIHPLTWQDDHGTYHCLIRRTELSADSTQLLCFLDHKAVTSQAAEPLSPGKPLPSVGASLAPLELNELLTDIPAMVYQLQRTAEGQLHFQTVTQSATDILGLSAATLQADPQTLLTHLHPLDRPHFEETLIAAATAQTPWRWEGRYYTPSGDLRWLQVIARRQVLPSEQTEGSACTQWLGVLLDITSRKQAAAATLEQAVMQQALADNEARFRVIAATIPGALFQLRVVEQQWSFDYVSDRIRDILGLTPVEIIQEAQAFIDQIHPADRDRCVTSIHTAATALRTWQFEGRTASCSGGILWWRGDAVPLPQPQGEVIFCGMLLDITKRKRIERAYRDNEQRLRMALGVSSMGVWTWQISTDQMTWTTEPGSLFDTLVMASPQTFETYVETLHPDDQLSLRRAVNHAVDAGRDYRIEYRIVLEDGSLRWIGERGGPWRDAEDRIIGIAATVVDITERKTADAALAESEERYRTLLDNLPGAVYRCRVDQQWTVLVKSEAIADITGYPADHLVHKMAWRLVHPDDYPSVEQDVIAAIAQNHSFELEYRILHADGSIRWVRDTGQPISDETGEIQLIDGVLIDITRRKQSETRFRELAQREALINRISNQIRESLELIPVLQNTVQAVRSQLAADRVLVYQFREDWNGEVVVEDVAFPWRSAKGKSGTDNCFPSGYANFYESGRVKAIDDVYQAGLDECHLAFLENLQVRASLVVPILLKKRLWGLLIAHECRSVRRWSGGEIELLISLAGQAGIAIGQADLYRQATENAERARREAENLEAILIELKRTQAQLVQTEKMSSLGQLVAGVAHEINNPVSFIDGNISHALQYSQDLLELVRQYQNCYPAPPRELAKLMQKIDLDFLTEDFPKLLASMRIGAERIKNIVASLRNFSRMDEADIKAVNIHDGLESTLMILQHRLKANGNRPEIVLHRRYGLVPPVECYAGQLNQVFMNLISNAIDALEDAMGGRAFQPEITVKTELISSLKVRITIADNGPGIPEQTRQRIFEPFYTTKPIGKGTGIGLSISYQIVTERHQGTLECQTFPEQGTSFYITIPLRQTAETVAVQKPSTSD